MEVQVPWWVVRNIPRFSWTLQRLLLKVEEDLGIKDCHSCLCPHVSQNKEYHPGKNSWIQGLASLHKQLSGQEHVLSLNPLLNFTCSDWLNLIRSELYLQRKLGSVCFLTSPNRRKKKWKLSGPIFYFVENWNVHVYIHKPTYLEHIHTLNIHSTHTNTHNSTHIKYIYELLTQLTYCR